MKAKAKATTKGETFDIALDLVGPDGALLVEGRYPSDHRKPVIKKLPVESTGRHLLVVRRRAGSTAEMASYKLAVKVRPAKETRKGMAELSQGQFTIVVKHGATLSAILRGGGMDPKALTISGPEGTVEHAVKTAFRKLRILPTLLDAGTGTYAIRFGYDVDASVRWKVRPPRKARIEVER